MPPDEKPLQVLHLEAPGANGTEKFWIGKAFSDHLEITFGTRGKSAQTRFAPIPLGVSWKTALESRSLKKLQKGYKFSELQNGHLKDYVPSSGNINEKAHEKEESTLERIATWNPEDGITWDF